jgi:hypothetical protein
LRLLSSIKTLKHLEIPTLFPQSFRDEWKPPAPLFRWAKDNDDYFSHNSMFGPVSPNPEFLTVGNVLLKYQRRTRRYKAHYKAVDWEPQEEQPEKPKTGMRFVDGDLVVKRPVALSLEFFGRTDIY